MSNHKTHFGFSTVDENEKAGKVAESIPFGSEKL